MATKKTSELEAGEQKVSQLRERLAAAVADREQLEGKQAAATSRDADQLLKDPTASLKSSSTSAAAIAKADVEIGVIKAAIELQEQANAAQIEAARQALTAEFDGEFTALIRDVHGAVADMLLTIKKVGEHQQRRREVDVAPGNFDPVVKHAAQNLLLVPRPETVERCAREFFDLQRRAFPSLASEVDKLVEQLDIELPKHKEAGIRRVAAEPSVSDKLDAVRRKLLRKQDDRTQRRVPQA